MDRWTRYIQKWFARKIMAGTQTGTKRQLAQLESVNF